MNKKRIFNTLLSLFVVFISLTNICHANNLETQLNYYKMSKSDKESYTKNYRLPSHFDSIADCFYRISKEYQNELTNILANNHANFKQQLCMSSSDRSSNFKDLATNAIDDLRNFIGNKIPSDCGTSVLYDIDLMPAANDEEFFIRIDNICPNEKDDAWKARNLPFARKELQDHIKLLYTILLSNHDPENKGTTIDSDDTTNESAETEYKRNDIVYKKKINEQNPFKRECSDYFVAANIDDEAPFNKAMQAATGNQDDEYYIDFRKGGSVRAFPGFIIVDKEYSTEESVYVSDNYQAIRKTALKLKQNLVNTDCDDLKVYIVAANALKSNSVAGEDKPIALYTTGGGAGIGLTAVAIGSKAAATAAAGTATAAAGTAAGTAAAGTAAGTAAAVAAGSSWIPVVGWVVAAASAITAGIIALWPSSIADIESVTVIERLY